MDDHNQENAASPADLGEPFGLTSRQVNEILADAQLQVRRPGRSGWTPTPTGAAFVQSPATDAKPILWLPAARDFITAAVNPVIRFIETQCYPSLHARTPLPDIWRAYENWSASEDIGRPLNSGIFDHLVSKLGAKCYPSPKGRIAVDLVLIADAPEKVRLEAAQRQTVADQIDRFVDTQCRQSDTTCAPAAVFYDAYVEWLRGENNARPAGRKEFFMRLEDRGYQRHRGTRDVLLLGGLQLIRLRPRLKLV